MKILLIDPTSFVLNPNEEVLEALNFLVNKHNLEEWAKDILNNETEYELNEDGPSVVVNGGVYGFDLYLDYKPDTILIVSCDIDVIALENDYDEAKPETIKEAMREYAQNVAKY